MTAMPLLRTERLLVRPFEPSDAGALADVLGVDAQDADALSRHRRYVAWAASAPDVLADLCQPPYGDRAVVWFDTGELVGAVGLVPLLGPFHAIPGLATGDETVADVATPEVGLYWAVAPRQRRRGIAAESARALADHALLGMRVRRVLAVTGRENAASIGVMRKLGMRIERNPHPEPSWLQVVGVLERARTASDGPDGTRDDRPVPSDAVEIRTATPADVPAIVPLWIEVVEHHAALDATFAPTPEAAEVHADHLLRGMERGDTVTFLALSGGTPVGFLTMRAPRPHAVFVDHPTAMVTDIGVARAHRRRGIARKLWETALAWARAQNAEAVELGVLAANESARRFWSSCGFALHTEIRRRSV